MLSYFIVIFLTYIVPLCTYTWLPSQEGVGQRGTKSFCGSVAFLAPEILLRKGARAALRCSALHGGLFTVARCAAPHALQ